MILKGFGCAMTEERAWLKLAEIFDSSKPLPSYDFVPFIGLCHGTAYLRRRRDINRVQEIHMDNYMFYHFLDNYQPNHPFVWPEDRSRVSRTLRATACGFLAAMCDDD